MGNIVKVKSMWAEGVFYVDKIQLQYEVNKLINDIENIMGKKIDFFLK
jgi:hypothetical protein